MPLDCQTAARRLLAEDRASTRARLAALERDFDAMVAAAAEVATDDEHDPEGTTAFDRQHVAALVSGAREHLAEIARALQRLDDGSYGRCERCGRPIGSARLAARPTATTCIDCAARRG
jgi:DnaK suppressor protein